MPLCNNDSDPTTPDCSASGKYINDDGVTTDLTDRHSFSFSYNHNNSATAGAAPDSMEIDIVSSGPEKVINGNDRLGGIQIYDYTHLNFTGAEYDVTATEQGDDGKPTTVNLGPTSFRKADDRLIWIPNVGVKIKELRLVTKISFTKKA
jgi:hypothetical protein